MLVKSHPMVQMPTCENVVFASLRDFLVIIVLQQYKFIRMVSGVTDERRSGLEYKKRKDSR